MFEAVLNCDKLQAKNFEELLKELHMYYNFNTLAELQQNLSGLGIRLTVKLN